ncbi:hypothetical protein ACP4OV_018541 [Aristida adscensionis]
MGLLELQRLMSLQRDRRRRHQRQIRAQSKMDLSLHGVKESAPLVNKMELLKLPK